MIPMTQQDKPTAKIIPNMSFNNTLNNVIVNDNVVKAFEVISRGDLMVKLINKKYGTNK